MKKGVKIIKLESRKHLSQLKVQANSLILDFKAKKLFCLLMPASCVVKFIVLVWQRLVEASVFRAFSRLHQSKLCRRVLALLSTLLLVQARLPATFSALTVHRTFERLSFASVLVAKCLQMWSEIETMSRNSSLNTQVLKLIISSV